MAFGDSLTVGYQSPTGGLEWPEPTPYTVFLEEKVSHLLSENAASDLRIVIHNRGISGELTEDMLSRFDRDVVVHRPDIVIILGGSNDLGWGVDPDTIASNLTEMYDTSLSFGINPVSCTVPSILGYDEGIPPRIELNRLIQEVSRRRGMVCVDLFAATGDSEGRLKEAYSNDGLHLSTQGYQTMAEAIFSGAVAPVVSRHLGKSTRER